MVVIWQAVIPPCLCAVTLLIKYIAFTEAHPVRSSGSHLLLLLPSPYD